MFRRRREGTHAQDNNEQEVDVGDVVELEPQVLGYEAERRVFGGSYLAFCLRQGNVEVDFAPRVSLFGACI